MHLNKTKFFVLTVFLMPCVTHAACALSSGLSAGTVNFVLPAMTTSLSPSDSGPKEVARVTIDKSEMASAMNMSVTTDIWSDCNSSSLVWTPLRNTLSGNSPNKSGYIETGIDNLFMYLYNSSGLITSVLTPATSGAEYSRSMTTIGSRTWTTLGDTTLVLYQTGPIRKGGVVPGGSLATLKLSDGGAIMNMAMSAFTVDVLGCSITTPTVFVPMEGNTFISSFSGVNSTVGDTEFTIDADCDSGLLPTLTFSGTTDGSDDTIFELTNKSDANAATGVGVQVKYKSNAITNNVAVSLEQTQTDGLVSFPFTANYIQTEDKVTAGKVSTSVTYTLSYQ